MKMWDGTDKRMKDGLCWARRTDRCSSSGPNTLPIFTHVTVGK